MVCPTSAAPRYNLCVPDRSQQNGAGFLFMLAAWLMLAHQVAGKAVRDGLFLSRFEPSDLPRAVAAAAIAAVLLGLLFARIMARSGPQHLVPAAFLAGSVIHIAEYW